MKRILFYVALTLQVAVITLLGWQYFLIDEYGESIDLLIEKGPYDFFDYEDHQGNIYVSYEINTIDVGNWPQGLEKKYNQRVYVLLEADERGFYNVKEVSDDKLEAQDNQVVFYGKYDYFDSMTEQGRITYGIEKINNQNLYSHIQQWKPVVATVSIAPWGQKKIINMKNVDN